MTGVESGAGFSNTPGVNLAGGARMADNTLGLFAFVFSVNTTVS